MLYKYLPPPSGQWFSPGALHRADGGGSAEENDKEAEESQKEGSQVSLLHLEGLLVNYYCYHCCN